MPGRLRDAAADAHATRQSSRNKTRKSYVMETDSDDFDEMMQEDGDVGADEDDDADASDIPTTTRTTNRRAAARRAREDMSKLSSDPMDLADEDADDGLPLGAPANPQVTTLKLKGPAPQAPQPKVTVTPVQDTGKFKSVEAKEMELDDDDDDEELSELGSEDEAPDGLNGEDADGDLDEEEDIEDDEEGNDIEDDEEDELDDDEEDEEDGDGARTPYTDTGADGTGGDFAGSRSSTPDISKLTKRQRGRIDQVDDSRFLQLPMEPQIKKHLTAEEHAMRRAEMARRRKNLSEKRNEEEKADTINRLLKKQAPKRRGKISQAEIAAQDRDDDEMEAGGRVSQREEEEQRPPNPVFVRWVSRKEGCVVGVPVEWEDTPEGRMFWNKPADGPGAGGKMVQEIEG